MAVRRWAAWRHTTERGPSRTAAVISSPRCGGQAVQHDGVGGRVLDQRVVDGESREGDQAGLPLVFLAHARPHVGVERGGPLGRLAAGRRSAHAAAPAGPSREVRSVGHVLGEKA